MVIDMMGMFVGLTVDRVYGMRHFKIDTYTRNLNDIPDRLAPYADGGFVQPDGTWILLRPSQLLADRRFTEVAA